MPSMIYEGERDEDGFYLLPPIQYPDGAWLLKIGPSNAFNPPLRTRSEADEWFQRKHQDPEFEKAAVRMLGTLFPGVGLLSWRPLFCVTDKTPTQNPYIDLL